MNRDVVDEIAQKSMGWRKAHLSREQGYIYRHGRRVARLSLHLRRRLFPDRLGMDDRLYAGALFHDLAKGIEPHAETGAMLAESLLREACTPEELETIAAIIRGHNDRGRDELPFYVKIVQDADILDHFGTQEIWLNFVHQAYDEKGPEEAVSYWKSKEYAEYAARSRTKLNYELSKQIFDEKDEFHRAFARRFESDQDGGLGGREPRPEPFH